MALAAFAAGLPVCVAALEVHQVVMAAETPADAPNVQAYRVFGSEQGLMQSTISSLAQDRVGYIWAGTEDGVARYDGRRWSRIALAQPRNAPPIPLALRATDDGAVWAVTDFGTLLRFDGTQMQRIGADDFGAMRVLSMAVDDATHVWVGTDRGAWRCAPDGCDILPATRDLYVTALHAGIGADEQPALWVGTVNQGVRRVDDPRGTALLSSWRLSAADGLPSDVVRTITQWGGADGRDLWIGCNFGMARLGRDSLVVWGEALDITSSYVSAFAHSIDDDGEPVLIAGLQRGGLVYVADDNRWHRYGLHEGLPDSGVASLLVTDRDRPRPRLWVGSYTGGVLRQEDLYWHVIDTRQGLPSAAVRSMGYDRFPDGERSYWVGTMEGPVRFRAGRWQPFGPAEVEQAIVYEIKSDDDGALWIATDRGLMRWDERGIEVWDRNRLGFISNTVITVFPRLGDDKRPELWVGSRRGMTRLVDGQPQLPPNAPAIGPTVRVFVETEYHGKRTLWLGGDRGLATWRDGQWTDDSSCLPFPDVMDVREVDHGGQRALWVATRGGIARMPLEGDAPCQQLAPPRLTMPVVYQLQFDEAGRAYLLGYEGVLRLTPDPAAPRDLSRMAMEHFDADDGLPALEFNRASMRDRDGRIWGGTVSGAVVLDPRREPVAQTLRPLLLTGARETAHEHPLQPGMRLPQGHAGVAFDYALLSYEREHLTRYRTQLVGLDGSPGPWKSAGSVRYERLPPGAYTLRVWARDAFGAVSGPREFPFSVDAPWWLGAPAIALAALSLIALGLLAGRFRARAVAQRAVVLERQVDERTRDLADANRRLEVASRTDPLTGLSNRRSFSQGTAGELEALVARAVAGQPGAARLLALLDLDYFKSINDRYGHAAGDAVLVRIADCLRHCSGARGHAFRWGGEEFLLVLDLDGAAQAGDAAQALLETVRRCRHPLNGREISVTCSLGWTLWPWHPRAPQATSLDQALTLADLALYRAKAGGRNRAVGALHDDTAPPLPEHPELRVRWQESPR